MFRDSMNDIVIPTGAGAPFLRAAFFRGPRAHEAEARLPAGRNLSYALSALETI